MPPIPPPPFDIGDLRAWAAEHGVLDRLKDPATVLRPRTSWAAQYRLKPAGRALLVEHFLDLGARSADLGRQPGRQTAIRELADIARAAREHLLHVARLTAATIASRAALDARAAPPKEPPLRALADRLGALLGALGAGATPRLPGTYEPRPLQLAEGPLRFIYREGVATLYQSVEMDTQVVLPIEGDLGDRSCSCFTKRCDHVLTALDAAIDVLRDPIHPMRRRLADELATPSWTRFLQAFGRGIAATVKEDAPPTGRLAFRIRTDHGTPIIEVLVQRPLKRGNWSIGQKRDAWDVVRRRDIAPDARDTKVLAAMTDGFAELIGARHAAPSHARTVRVLGALIGHPRLSLDGRADTLARVERAALRLLIEPSKEGLALTLAVGERRVRPAELLRATDGTPDVIAIDEATATVQICTIDERAQALIAALARHPATFPPESHDELLRQLQPLQASVVVDLPEALQGETIDAEARLIVRLSPPEDAAPGSAIDMVASLHVRPIAGGPTFHPGEGPAVVLHALAGRRVAARRALAEEVQSATALVHRLPTLASSPVPEGPGGSPWTFSLQGHDSVLDLLAALREVGDAVVVEWPEPERRIDLAGPALRRTLKLRITDRRDWFGVEGEVTVDGEEVSFAALLDAVRQGRRYLQVGPQRFAAIEDDLRRRVATAGDVLFDGRHGLELGLPGADALADLVGDPRQLQAVARWRSLVQRIDAARALTPVVPAGLTATLRPYQVEGFQWLSRLAAWGIGGCLADDMGLGKTVQALALLLDRAALGPQLVIAPTSVGPNWLAEAARFAPGLRVQLYRDLGRSVMLEEAGPGDLLVTSYGLATRDAEALAAVRFATLVLDEAQAIKNGLTRRARAVRDLNADFHVALTGTPVENHLGELWSLMRILAPGLFGSWDQFRERFAAPIERGRDPGRRAALARTLRPFLLRRAKADVAPELPPRIEVARIVDRSPAERRLYDDARRAALAAIAASEGDARFTLLAALTKLRRLACHPRLLDDASTVPSSKLAALREIVAELRETGHRALVFSQFTSHLALVREALERDGVTYTYLDGKTPSEERTRRIAAFQAGGADLFLISLKAGGTGLNLTAADTVIHLDPWWNPAVEDQATDRAHRIGQTRAVTVIRLIARGTIEEGVLALHGEKRALSASVFDEEGGASRLSVDDLADLIRMGAATGGGASEVDDEAGDAMGAEVVDDDSLVPPSKPPRERARAALIPAVVAAPVVAAPVAGPRAAATQAPSRIVALPTDRAGLLVLADRLLDHLAARKQVADRRYDSTLRTYERSLRRFADYVVSRSAEGTVEPLAVMDGYLEALSSGTWPVPSSEPAIARVVMNHMRAFVTQGAAGG